MKKPLLLAGLVLACLLVPLHAQEPISRLPAVADPPSDPVLRQLFDDTRARGGQILNLHLTLGNAPKMAQARRAIAYALRYDAETPRLLREIAILRTGQLMDADYELNQHIPMA